MKSFILLLGFIFFTTFCEGQVQKGLKVEKNYKPIYLRNPNSESLNNQPALFVNGYFFTQDILERLDPKKVKDIKIEKEDTTIFSRKYYGKVFIITKEKIAKPSFIYLAELQNIYPKIKNISTIYTIDEKLIKNSDKKLIDKNYILKIEVSKMNSKNENISLQVVNIVTKSEENIKRDNTIYIR